MESQRRSTFKKHFTQAFDSFAEEFNLTKVESESKSFFHFLDDNDVQGWKLRVTLHSCGFEWKMWPLEQGRLEKIVFKKVSAKIPIYGYINDEGLLRTNLNKNLERLGILNVAEIFHAATDLYNNLLKKSEHDREFLYRGAESVYEKCMDTLLEKEGL